MELKAGILSGKSDDFHLKEYECLRDEIQLLSQEQRALERNVIVAVGVTWAWLYSKTAGAPAPIPAWTYWIPFLFSALGALRAFGIEQTFGDLGNYIQMIEDAFRKQGGPQGWEHFETKGTADSKGAFLFWGILNLSTFAVATLRIFHIIK